MTVDDPRWPRTRPLHPPPPRPEWREALPIRHHPPSKGWVLARAVVGFLGFLVLGVVSGVFVGWLMSATDGLEPDELDAGNRAAIAILMLLTAGAVSFASIATYLVLLLLRVRTVLATVAGLGVAASIVLLVVLRFITG